MIWLAILGVAAVVWIVLVRQGMQKKYTPAGLRKMFKNYVVNFEQTELQFIFKEVSNDGKEIIYKEHTDSRHVFFVLQSTNTLKDYLLLRIKDNNNNIIREWKKEASLLDEDDKCMKNIHSLYVQEFQD